MKFVDIGYMIILAVIIVLTFWLSNNSDNLKEYNRHMCVDVYGKDENCN